MVREKKCLHSNNYHCSLRWLGIVLTFLLLITWTEKSQAAPAQPTKYYSSLFDVPLEELLNIQVDAKNWAGQLNDGIFVISQETLVKTSKKVRRFRRRQRESRDYKKNRGKYTHNPFGKLNKKYGEALLVIDGCELGPLEHLSDFLYYTDYIRDNLIQVEIYLGESATWWNGSRYHAVINLVTRISEDDLYNNHNSREEALRK